MKCDDLIAAEQRDYWTRKQQQRRDSTQESADGNYRDPEKKSYKKEKSVKEKRMLKAITHSILYGDSLFFA